MQQEQDYLLNHHEADLIDVLQAEDTSNHFAININFIVLYEHQPKLVVELLKEPEKCLETWDQATINAQIVLLKKIDTKSKLKSNVHCRIYHLPGLPEVCRIFFPSNEDAGKFLQVSGTVMTMSAVKLLQYQRSYICIKCKYPNLITAEYEKKYIIKQPKKCMNPDTCLGTNFIQIGEFDSEHCKDFQQIKIQEHIKKLGVGSMPNTMWVTLEDDLVDRCKPGDDVTICGIVKRRWGEFCKGNKIDIDIVLKANNIQVDSNASSTSATTKELQEMFSTFWSKYSSDPLGGRDLILSSFCPQIYGMYVVKLAIATVLAGGCQMEDTNFTGVCTRPEPHLLLVGDPGTGKSQLLRFVSKIVPRSVLTTGVGSTAAGLTVAAVMEHGEWQLEGGALVMSDGGVCCIDEFNSMKEHDRTSIHEAMEQQTISVAKASIVCKLNTRCSILAACNPKGNLDSSNPLCINTALPSPLLSRFDVTLLLRDTVNEQWDQQVADYILNGRSSYSKLTDDKLWNTDILQSYFVIIKKIKPKLSEDAESVLSRYYQTQRRINSRNKARTTVRLLESLVRLSQGHARLMFHTEVQIIDSIYAVVLVDSTLDDDSSVLNLNISSRTAIPENPTKNYCNILENVLNKLQLQDVLRKEMELMRKNMMYVSENVQSRFFNEQTDIQDTIKPEVKRSSHDVVNVVTTTLPQARMGSSFIDNQEKSSRDVNSTEPQVQNGSIYVDNQEKSSRTVNSTEPQARTRSTSIGITEPHCQTRSIFIDNQERSTRDVNSTDPQTRTGSTSLDITEPHCRTRSIFIDNQERSTCDVNSTEPQTRTGSTYIDITEPHCRTRSIFIDNQERSTRDVNSAEPQARTGSTSIDITEPHCRTRSIFIDNQERSTRDVNSAEPQARTRSISVNNQKRNSCNVNSTKPHSRTGTISVDNQERNSTVTQAQTGSTSVDKTEPQSWTRSIFTDNLERSSRDIKSTESQARSGSICVDNQERTSPDVNSAEPQSSLNRNIHEINQEKRKRANADKTRNFLKRFKKRLNRTEQQNDLNASCLELNIREHSENDGESKKCISKNTDISCNPSIVSSSKLPENISEKNDEYKKSADRDSTKKSKSSRVNSDNFVKDDLEMMKLIPNASDGFNIDLDFDWDNVNNF